MSQQSRVVVVGAAQLGPIQKADTRASVVERLIALLRQAKERSCDLVVFPELALTTFFPRWFVDDISEADHWYEKSMPSVETQPLFDEAKKLGIGFSSIQKSLALKRFMTMLLMLTRQTKTLATVVATVALVVKA